MQYANGFKTPLAGGEKFSGFGSDPVNDPQLYRSIVGALQYASITRPEISYAVKKCVSSSIVLLKHIGEQYFTYQNTFFFFFKYCRDVFI